MGATDQQFVLERVGGPVPGAATGTLRVYADLTNLRLVGPLLDLPAGSRLSDRLHRPIRQWTSIPGGCPGCSLSALRLRRDSSTGSS